MSFWRTFGFQTASPVDTILDKESFTLEDLLDEEEVVQETKSQNKKLMDFLTKTETLKKLISYVTSEVVETQDQKKKYRYPFISCEILSSEAWTLLEALFEEPAILGPLFDFLTKDPPPPPPLTTFVFKVVGSFISKKGTETTKLLKERNLVVNFANNIGHAPTVELLTKIVGADDGSKEGVGQWLHDSDFLGLLIDKFDSTSVETHENVAALVEEIITVYNSQNKNLLLVQQLENEKTLSKLFGHMLSGKSESQLLHGLGIVSELLRRYSKDSLNAEAKIETLPALFGILNQKLDKFVDLLLKPAQPKSFTLTFGTIVPLGFARLKVLEFISLLIKTNYACIHELVIKSKVINACVELFFQYAWNNFLHSVVAQLLEYIIRGPNQQLKMALLQDVQLVDKICEAVAKNDEEVKQPKGTRKGYMAFVTIISEHLITESSKDEEMNKFLTNHQVWTNYVKTSLAETRQADNKSLGKPLSIGGDTSDDEDEQDEKNPAQLVFTQYLAQQGFSGVYPEEFHDEDEYDEEGEGAFDDEGSFEPKGTFNIEEKGFELESDESDNSSDEEKNPDSFYNEGNDTQVDELAEKIQPMQTDAKENDAKKADVDSG